MVRFSCLENLLCQVELFVLGSSPWLCDALSLIPWQREESAETRRDTAPMAKGREGRDKTRYGKMREQSSEKGVVVHHALTRGLCITFWLGVPSLQVAPRFACSVASLSQSPGH